MKVETDITKPLARAKFLAIDKNQLWVPFKYERLPTFYFHCGVINLIKRNYPKSSQGMSLTEKKQPQYEPWIYANLAKSYGTTTRKYGGNKVQQPHNNRQQWKPDEEASKESGNASTGTQAQSKKTMEEFPSIQENYELLGKVTNREKN